MGLELFHPAVAAWFERTFERPTEPQLRGWPSIREGRHTLIAAPTGSGKTLAAFLAAIDDLVRQGLDDGLVEGTQVVYVSPLKALSNDIQKNLQEPLAGIRVQLLEMGLPDVEVRTEVRTGDTPSHERTRMVKSPPHILVTTPESLYLLLTSDGGRGMLSTAHTVIVDEIHAIADDKRGSHLALTLERLEALIGRPLTRIGLSATQRPLELVARFLTGTGDGNLPAEESERLLSGGPGADASELTDPADQLAPDAGCTDGGSPGAGRGADRDDPEARCRTDHHRLAELDARVRWPDCTVVDDGHRRDIDLAIELLESPLEAVMSGEAWEEIYDRLAALVEEHATTLIFVNTRRMAERLARHLAERLGEDGVTSHHGSLSKEKRLDAETRLKAGELRALVATASLELGIDIGAIDLVCQLGSTRSIATLLQRAGRSGHTLGGLPKGRLFPLSRDELVECAALIDSVRRGELDRLIVPQAPLDILAQQIVAEVAAGERHETEIFELFRRAWPFRHLRRSELDDVVRMLADGFTTRRGRRGAWLHHDAVHGMLRPRRGARLAALTSGGAIPDQAEFQVVLEPQGTVVGTLDEDFSIESLPGDIFQLGNMSYRILRIEQGRLRVEDARGQPPTIPFWFGEAPGRTAELSESVSRLRTRLAERLDAAEAEGVPLQTAVDRTVAWAGDELGLEAAAAEQLVEYLAAAKRALGTMPSQQTLIVERFFDEAGDMHVVIHSPFGSRLNRAWGLALRKRFCRQFNFELQAAATEDAIVLSLGPTHSFPLDDVFRFLHWSSVRHILIQAFLDAPMFPTRWRWNASRALAVLRWRGGKRVPPRLQRMDAEDLMAVVFPDQLACLENIAGDRDIPDHPLVDQTVRDCLEEAMDIDRLEELLRRLEAGEVELVARDLREPSPLAHEILNARPYAFLDEAPLEERRTQAVMTRRWIDPATAGDLGALDQAAIDKVRGEAWPRVRDVEEMHDALVMAGFMTEEEARAGLLDDDADGATPEGRPPDDGGEATEGWEPLLRQLASAGRATLLRRSTGARAEMEAETGAGTEAAAAAATDEATDAAADADGSLPSLWVAAERLSFLEAVLDGYELDPPIEAPERLPRPSSADAALVEVVRGRLECVGPTTAAALAEPLGVGKAAIDKSLLALEAEGFVLRGQFTPGSEQLEWCDRRLLARIHRYTLNRLRAEIEPVAPRDFLKFLLAWQRLEEGERARGPESLAGLVEQLEGFAAPAAAWEGEVLPARMQEYDPVWLDALCLAGRVAWGRLPAPAGGGGGNGRRSGPIRATPIALIGRDTLELWQALTSPPQLDEETLSRQGQAVLAQLAGRGASFFSELQERSGLLASQLEDALGELVAWGLVTADSFTGLRALLVPSSKRPPHRGGRRKGSVAIFGVENAGRWSLLWGDGGGVGQGTGGRPATMHPGRRNAGSGQPGPGRLDPDAVEHLARVLLRRYGVVFRRLLERESVLPPWRELLRVYRSMEARGEIRGGRFVQGFQGEQYALPEAVGKLRQMRRRQPEGELVSVSAADPLNLVGILTPGERLPALAGNRLLYRDGVPIAVLQAGEVRYLEEMSSGQQWEARNALVRRSVPPRLRAYLGRSA